MQAEATAAAARIAPATDRLATITRQYAASAVAPVADNPAQAEARLGFARQELDEAAAAVAEGRPSDAAVGIRAAEESVDQANLLSDAVDRLAADLADRRPRPWPPASPTSSTTCRPGARSATRTPRHSPTGSPRMPPPSARR